jgi:regulator of sirC expression with transglutaminase-like and TPR domain
LGEEPTDPESAHCLRCKGLALAALDRPQEALAALSRCWDLLEQTGRCEELAELLPGLATVLGELGRSAEVELYRLRLQDAMEASTAAGSPGGY